MGGSVIEPDTTILPLSLVLKEMIMTTATYEGSPAQPVMAPLARTENSIRVDHVSESPNVGDDDRAVLPLPGPVRLAVQVEEPTCPRGSLSPDDPGQDRALAPDAEKPHPAGELLPAGRSGESDLGLRDRLQPPQLPREHC